MNTPDQLLASILDQHCPKTLLIMGNRDLPALNDFLSTQSDVNTQHHALDSNTSLQNIESRFDICLITPEFVALDKKMAIELFAGIRNRLCHHIYLFLPLAEAAVANDAWQASDLYSLGLKRIAEFSYACDKQSQLSCFAYEIESYIKKRDWNNSRYWANPENFGKYWW